MASLIRRFKGKSKPSDKENDETNQDTVTSEKDESQKSMSLSPYTSDSDSSPQRLISQGGSLFSGMKLTKTSRELEPESSPYTPATGESHNDKSMFDFMGEADDSNNQESGSSFTFINQSEPIDELSPSPNYHPSGEEHGSGFSFLMADSSPPTNTTTEGDDVPHEENSTGFSFLSEEPDSKADESHSSVSVESLLHGMSTNTQGSLSIDQVSASSMTMATSSTPTPPTMTPTSSSLTTPVPLSPPNPVPQSIPTPAPTPQKVNRQAPPNKKKKKHKAVRPGQERHDDAYSGLLMDSTVSSDLDGISISSHGSVEPLNESRHKQEDSNNQLQQSADTLTGGATDSTRGMVQEPTDDDLVDSIQEPNDNTRVDSGDTREPTGMDSSDTQESTGNTRMDSTHESTGDTRVDSIPTDHESSSIVPANRTTTEDTPETGVGNEDTVLNTGVSGDESLIVEVNDEGNEEDLVMQDEPHIAGCISSDLADVFDNVSDHRLVTAELSPSDPKPVKETGNYSVELSPIEKIATLLEATDSNTKAIRDSGEKVADQFGTVLLKHFKTIETQTKKHHRVQELKTKEASALSEENYEQAEELRKELESINVGNNVAAIMDAQATVKEWLDKCSKSVSSQVLAHHKAREALMELKEEQTNSLIKLEKEFSSVNAREKMKLQTLRDEIERERGHISLDSEHLKKRQLLLQDEVSERAEKFITCKKVLEVERKETLQEIENLEKKLIELKQKESELLAKICSEDESIATISNEFSTERDQLNLEETKLDKKKQDLLNEENSLNELQLSFEASMKLHNENKERIQLLLKEAETKITEISNDQCLLENSLANSSDWELEDICEVLKPDHKLQRLLASESSQEDIVRQTSNEVLSLQTSVSSSCRKLSDKEAHLQKLQEAKKVAVSARQYREAARLSTEEKQILASCSELREEIRKFEDEVKDTNEQLLAQTQELDKLREQRELVEKEGDIQSIKKLALAMVTVQEKLQCINKRVPYYTVLSQWQELIKLIVQDLCTKHTLDIQEYLIPTGNGEEGSSPPSVLPNSNDDMDSSDGLSNLNEGCTPMETVSNNNDNIDTTLHDELKQSIEALEMRIAECCENEEFEEAAALDEELQDLKNQQMKV